MSNSGSMALAMGKRGMEGESSWGTKLQNIDLSAQQAEAKRPALDTRRRLTARRRPKNLGNPEFWDIRK